MELMYRQVFTPNMSNINISVPNEWRGMNIEVITFPVISGEDAEKKKIMQEKRTKRNEILDKYLIDLSDYKFNRDEANDYD